MDWLLAILSIPAVIFIAVVFFAFLLIVAARWGG